MKAIHLPARVHAFTWRQYLNPVWIFLANADDGYFGVNDVRFNPSGGRTLLIALTWWLRNPMHNLTWYVLGVAGRARVIVGPQAPRIADERGGWLWHWVIADGIPIPLPFLSYKRPGGLRFYVGWRPSGALSLPRFAWGGA